MANERHPLTKVIFDDLVNNNKIAILLLLLIVITAVATVWLTNQTRELIAEQGNLISQQHKLNDQYLHLQLEENSKTQKIRVEAAARQFGLQPIEKDQEVILVE